MRVKLSFPGHEGDTDLSQYTGNNAGFLDGIEFRVNDGVESADAWFVFEDVVQGDALCEVPADRVFFLSAETGWEDDKFLRPNAEEFFRQFARVFSPYPVLGAPVSFSAPFLPWMVNGAGPYFVPHTRDLNFLGALDTVKKSRPLSIICSDQRWTAGHRLRFAFAERLKKEFGDDIDWFGKGVSPIPEKWDGLAPYERTIVLENRSTPGIYSEKILDAFLTLSVPVYWGDTTISKVLPVPEDQIINILDFEGSVSQIRKIVDRPPGADDYDRLRLGRQKVLDELHFLRRIGEIAGYFGKRTSDRKEFVTLKTREAVSSRAADSPQRGRYWRSIFGV
jgi:hypothetical protein